jgi:hypothetical protein
MLLDRREREREEEQEEEGKRTHSNNNHHHQSATLPSFPVSVHPALFFYLFRISLLSLPSVFSRLFKDTCKNTSLTKQEKQYQRRP